MCRDIKNVLTILFVLFSIFLSGCAATTVITPVQNGATSSPLSKMRSQFRITPYIAGDQHAEIRMVSSNDSSPDEEFAATDAMATDDNISADESESTTEEGDEVAPEEEGEEEEEEEEESTGLLQFIPHTVGPLTAESTYTGEMYTNTRGGVNTNGATRYRGNLDLIINGDLEELVGLKGASFFVYGGDVHGEGLSNRDVGDWQIISDIDPYPYVSVTQMQEYWLRQEFFDGDLYFKVGRQDANADFGFSDLAGDFINNSFVTIPTIPFPVWPAQSLGVSGFAELTDELTLGVGIYESNKLNGLWGNSVSDKRGQIALGHLEWKTQTGPNGQLPGTWRVGAWLDTGKWNEITTAPTANVFNNNYGFWFSGDQLLFKEQYGTDDEQGLGVFCEIGWSPGDRNFLDQYYGAGVVYRGLLPGRDDDNCGVGLADIEFGRQTQERDGFSYETVVEVFYKAQVSENLVIQPDLQFIANPGGNGNDALVFGLRFELVL